VLATNFIFETALSRVYVKEQQTRAGTGQAHNKNERRSSPAEELLVRTIRWIPAAAALATGVAIGLAHPAAAQVACTVTVTGQNDPALDVPAVTSAVNAPTVGESTVCLAGTFDFGPPPAPPATSTISIAPPPTVSALHIVGLNDAKDRKATIRGGYQPLTLTPAATVATFSIENLRFVQPAFTAITILRGNGSVRIADVHIAGVQTFFVPAFNARFREGIAVTSLLPVTGTVTIENSVIDGGSYGPDDGTLAISAGIALTGPAPNLPNQPFTARVQLADNRIANWSGSGILANGIARATIERNKIDPGAFANSTPACFAPNNAGVANGISLGNVAESTIRDNTIALTPALTGADTPPVCTAALILAGNATGGANDNIVYRNRIRGVGSYAMIVGSPLGSVDTGNLYALNPVGNFTAAVATLLIGPGAIDNSFVGNFPTVVGDQNANTVITR
jgi:hypothetical protein